MNLRKGISSALFAGENFSDNEMIKSEFQLSFADKKRKMTVEHRDLVLVPKM